MNPYGTEIKRTMTKKVENNTNIIKRMATTQDIQHH